jgi:hypothetical protein
MPARSRKTTNTTKTPRATRTKTIKPIRFNGYEAAAIAGALPPSITVRQRATVVQLTRDYIRDHGLVTDVYAEYLTTIEKIATALQAQRVATADRNLDRLDAELEKARGTDKGIWPSDEAADRYTPCIEAAMFFGYALGLALAHNGEGGAR